MTEQELQEIKERSEKATPGPWTYVPGELIEDGADSYYEDAPNIKGPFTVDMDEYWALGENNADFIAHSREDVPALLAEVERQITIASEFADRFSKAAFELGRTSRKLAEANLEIKRLNEALIAMSDSSNYNIDTLGRIRCVIPGYLFPWDFARRALEYYQP